ncbi:MAG: phage Gp37/Gp68 family protein [Lentisphaerae bacterium]|nr:phage Gp37/Gp68 family protein [Lentisphaerota bacterium]
MSKKSSNMYRRSVKQWNPFVGCRFDCSYCKTSFQAQAKRQKHNCIRCYNYEPHEHPSRLGASLPRTEAGEFIFTISSGDVAFCPTAFLKRILERITSEPSKTFLLQSKNPKTFGRAAIPSNVILGTTLETNRDALAQAIGKAPAPSKRFHDFMAISHPTKMVTCEPIMDFDLDVLGGWILQLKPVMVWVGYDSRKNGLVEPPLKKVRALEAMLRDAGIEVIEKKIREGRLAA